MPPGRRARAAEAGEGDAEERHVAPRNELSERMQRLENSLQSIVEENQQLKRQLQEQQEQMAKQKKEVEREQQLQNAQRDNQYGLEDPPQHTKDTKHLFALWRLIRDIVFTQNRIYHTYKFYSDPENPCPDFTATLREHHECLADASANIGGIRWVVTLGNLSLTEQMEALTFYQTAWRSSTARTNIIKSEIFARAALVIPEVGSSAQSLWVKKRSVDKKMEDTKSGNQNSEESEDNKNSKSHSTGGQKQKQFIQHNPAYRREDNRGSGRI